MLTSGPAGHVRDGAVAVRGDRIAAVGPWAELRRDFPDAEVVGDGTGILTPGFVSSHGHFSEGLVTGIGETHTLWEWFVHVACPIEPYLTREIAYVGTLLKGAEMALSGVTTAADMFCHAPGPEPAVPGVVDALERARPARRRLLRGPGRPATRARWPGCWPSTRRCADAAAGSRRCRFRVGLATVPARLGRDHRGHPRSCSGHPAAARAPARGPRGGHRVPDAPAAWARSSTPPGPGCWTRRWSPRTASGWTTPTSTLLREHDVAVAHNPVSNMILASGVAPVPRLLREGVTVGLGLDGPASNDSQDMLGTLKTAALLQKVHHLQATAMTAPQVLRMATIGGARALGHGRRGRLAGAGQAGRPGAVRRAQPVAGERARPVPGDRLLRLGPRRATGLGGAASRWSAGGRVLGVDLAELLPRARELAVKLAVDAGLDSELARAVRPADLAGGAVTITLPDTDAVDEHGYVPVISLAGLDDPARRAEVAGQLGAALRRSGFYVAVDHIVPLPVFDQLSEAALEFFHRPEEEKARFGPSAGDATRRGFTSRYRAAQGIGVHTDEDAAEAWAFNPYDEALGWRDLSGLRPRPTGPRSCTRTGSRTPRASGPPRWRTSPRWRARSSPCWRCTRWTWGWTRTTSPGCAPAR